VAYVKVPFRHWTGKPGENRVRQWPATRPRIRPDTYLLFTSLLYSSAGKQMKTRSCEVTVGARRDGFTAMKVLLRWVTTVCVVLHAAIDVSEEPAASIFTAEPYISYSTYF
jgi:hypothetical protein